MEERNLLSIAYKHVTGTLRTSWRTVEGIEKQEKANGRATLREQTLIRRQREKIELEARPDACKDLFGSALTATPSPCRGSRGGACFLPQDVRLIFSPPSFTLIYMRVLVVGLAYTGRAIIIGTLLNLLDIMSESRLRS